MTVTVFESQVGKKVVKHEDPREVTSFKITAPYTPPPNTAPLLFWNRNLPQIYLASVGDSCIQLEIHGKVSLSLNRLQLEFRVVFTLLVGEIWKCYAYNQIA